MDHNAAATGAQSDLTTMIGGEHFTAHKLDGSTESVFIRVLPVRDLPRYSQVIEDEERSVELFCSKQDGWAATLTRESHEQIVEKGEELNVDFFVRWTRRRSKSRLRIVQSIDPDITRKIDDAVKAALSASAGSAQPSA